ncbi:MAG: SDR family oxidoreductase [Microthrixaceae bacterium]
MDVTTADSYADTSPRGPLLGDKVIAVTGVGAGLGREITTTLLRDGARVVVAARDASSLNDIVEPLDPTGEHVAVATADICVPEDCDRIVETATRVFGGLDGLVQVAAYEGAAGGLMAFDADRLRRSVEVNVIGSLQMVRSAAAVMSESGGGSVVVIGSQASMLPLIPQIGYAASKGALHSAVRHMARELGRERIRVNSVVPSWMWGPNVALYVSWQASSRGVSEEEVRREITAGIPLGEIVPDEDVADAVAFLMSDRARSITGQALLVNGGEHMP